MSLYQMRIILKNTDGNKAIMKDHVAVDNLMSKTYYDAILRHTLHKLKGTEVKVRLETLIANKILLKGLTLDGVDPEQIVNENFYAVYNEVLDELRGDCLRYCLGKLSDPEPAQDIAQEAMMQLLTSRNEIRDPHAWLLSVCHNLICAHYRIKAEDQAMVTELEAEDSVCRMIASADELSGSDLAKLARIPGLATCPEYNLLREITEYSSLREYAITKGISYERVKQLSKSSRRDLRAKCLRHFGWTVTPDVLGYNEYKSIRRYLRRLFSVAKANSTPGARKNRLRIDAADPENAFADVAEIGDWTLTLRPEGIYELFVVGMKADEQPKFIQIKVRILPNHRIETLSCEVKQPAYVINAASKVNIPMDKGICPLSPEEVAELIRRQTELNPTKSPEPGIRFYHGRAPRKNKR